MSDFKLYLEENKISEQQLIDWMTYMDNYYYIDIPSDVYYKSNSNIHGEGLFALTDIEEGAVVGVASIKDNRTPLARYTNHSKNPNIEFIKVNEDVVGYALEDILKDEEIVVDYRHPKLK